VRIVAGEARGRRLAAPPGSSTRPTSDRAREGLFGTVASELGGSVAGTRWLDLFAGSGAIGLEALSRGAAAVLFVESDARAASVIRENITRVGLPGGQVAVGPVQRVLGRGPGGPAYDVVFADPPYAVGGESVALVLDALNDQGWLCRDALIVIERASRSGDLSWPEGYYGDKARRYGEATFWYGRFAA
jgi:16S rRNA (guanine966-N2)-methyltransferase